MEIKGHWYSAESSRRQAALLTVTGGFYELVIDDEDGSQHENQSGSIESLRVSDRIGNVPRKIYWPDNSLFESSDNDLIDTALLTSRSKHKPSSLIDKIEKNTSWVVAAVVITVAFTAGFFKYGLPYIATKAAYSIPITATEHISEQTLSTLDRFLFEESALPKQRQLELTQRFNQLTQSVDGHGFDFKLHFRNMDGMPNAMALPGGDIVVTDAFVQLADKPEEIDAVLLHEIGHVVERHGLTQVIQASTVSVIVAIAIGDASGASDLMVGVPTMLMQSSYSRDAESRADEYAFSQMAALNIDPIHFATIIRNLGKAAIPAGSNSDSDTADKTDDSEKEESERTSKLMDYLSSHPQTEARAKRAIELSEQFRQSN